MKLFKTKTGKDAGKNIRSLQKLRREVEKAKRTLSSEQQTKIEIEAFFQTEDFNEVLTRAKFEELNNDLFQSTLIPVENVMKDAHLKKTDIAEVILVGGSTRIPKIRKILKEYFNGKPPSTGVNPDEAVGT
jgi:molecular chaperone DnaK (HSP70)